MITRQQLTSLLVRLQHATVLELSDALQELLAYPDVLDQVVPTVESRIDAGAYVLDEPLASLIVQTRSSGLYEKVRERLFKNNWTLVTLFKSQYPDPEIEKKLCARLYETASDDSNPVRSCILDAMREVGSEESLPTLEAILFDFEPSARIRQEFSGALGLVGSLEAKSRAGFVKRVALAIEDIKARAAATTESMVPKTEAVQEKEEVPERVDETSNANRNRTQAERYLDADPEVAIVFIRRGAEALAKDLYRRLGHERNGKPARKMMLEELLKPLRDCHAPELFKLLVQTFQLFGNFAAHDQDDQSTYVTKELASALLSLFDEAIVIYEAWLAKKPS